MKHPTDAPEFGHLLRQTRRHFLRDTALGLGATALALLDQPTASADTAAGAAAADVDPFLPRQPHFAPRAKSVIYLSMSGGPPHLDLFDYKPELVRRDGEDCPESLTKGKQFAFTSGTPKLLGTRQKFAQRGQSGAWMSDALPHLAGVADELTIIKSVWTEQFNHGPAELLLYTGFPRAQDRARWGPGSRTAWDPRAGICRATSCSFPDDRSPAPVKRPGEAAFCLRFIRVCNAAPAAIPCCTCRTPREWIEACVA